MLSTPPAHPERLVYLGSPAVAVAPLRALVDAGRDVVLVVSQPDRKRGRGAELQPSPVKAAALELGLPVTDRVDDVLDVDADLGVVVAFGQLIKPHVLEQLPMVNLHFSLLPRWRGAAPVERAILAGDAETGVCLMALEEGLDTGGVYRRAAIEIGANDTLEALWERLVIVGTDLLLDALDSGLGQPVAQEGEATYAAKLDPAEFEIDWTKPSSEIHRIVRLGRAWTTYRNKRLKVHAIDAGLGGGSRGPGPSPGVIDGIAVGTGDGAIGLVEVQPEGRARQVAADWVRGARPEPGEHLGG